MGRPPKYKSPEEMQIKIDAYFKQCDEGQDEICTDKAGRPLTDKEGQPIYYNRKIPYTKEGLDLALDFLSHNAREYYRENKPEFMPVITRAEKKVIKDLSIGGLQGRYQAQVVGLMLKTHGGYMDKQKVEITGENGIPLTLFPTAGEYTMVEWEKQTADIDQEAKARARVKPTPKVEDKNLIGSQ
jgi:hypothetical protein